jgi:hypothetical protein
VFVPDLSQLESNRKPTEEERAEMSWTNPEAATLAREILTQEKMDALRDRVTEEVAQYRVLLAGANCGSVFSFKKTHPEDASKHYWYAAIKSGDAWYTTARDKRVIESDEALIEWLISLGAMEAQHELTAGETHATPAIDASSSDA